LSGSESMMVIWVTGWLSVCESAPKADPERIGVKRLTLQGSSSASIVIPPLFQIVLDNQGVARSLRGGQFSVLIHSQIVPGLFGAACQCPEALAFHRQRTLAERAPAPARGEAAEGSGVVEGAPDAVCLHRGRRRLSR
jgi:hypothetical protein